MTPPTQTNPLQSVQFHQFAADDFQGMAAIFNAHNRSIDNQAVLTATEMEQNYRRIPNIDLDHDVITIKDRGDLIGYGVINWHPTYEDERVYILNIRVLSDYATGELETLAIERLIQRAQAISQLHPTTQQEWLQAPSIIHPNTKFPQALEAAGFERVRYSYKMVRDLHQPITLLPLPEGIEIRPALPEHYRAIWAADVEAFQDHWGTSQTEATDENYQRWISDPDAMPELWKIAWDGDQVVGMVLNYVDEEFNTEFNLKRGYTEGICTRRPWRRQGISAALLSESLNMFKEMGMTEAALGVDAHNPYGALGVYERAGFKTVQELIWFRRALTKE